MRIGISQPTFLPWCGYIALIDNVDEFIFLDDVQFEKRSWHQRNYIKFLDMKHLITVPVITKGKRFQKINETNINYNSNFVKKHITTITQAYSKTQFFNLYSEEIFNILKKKHKLISELNISLINYFCKVLSISTKIHLSSKFNFSSSGSNLILEICKKKKCKEYISTVGAEAYLEKNNFKLNKIKLNFFEFNHQVYNQQGKSFLSNLSIIDVLFNIGPKTTKYLRNNFKVLI